MVRPNLLLSSLCPTDLYFCIMFHARRSLTKLVQGTSDVRLDPQLNKKVWESGIKGVPYRLRVRVSRKRNDEEGAKEKLYSYVQAVNVKDREVKGLQTVVVEDS